MHIIIRNEKVVKSTNLHFHLRNLIIIFLLAIPILSFCQYEPGFLPEFFFDRQPSARAEAMGKAYASMDGDLTSVYYNPAGIATIKGLAINSSYTPPDYYLIKGYYTFNAVGFEISKKIQVALSRYQFNMGKTFVINANKTPYTENNTLTISSEPVKNLFIGINGNYFVWQPGQDKLSTSVYLDFGVIKKIKLSSGKNYQHTINIGSSISNVNYGETKVTVSGITTEYKLPVITRYGVNYLLSFSKPYIIDSLKTLTILVESEYQMLLNSVYRSAIKVGGEVILFELLSFRVGYYKEKVYDFGFPDHNKREIKSITYGLGIQIPLYRLTKMPFNINFDYTSLPQPTYSNDRSNWDDFKTYTLRLKIFLKNKNYHL
ncbi:MAG: hypothetical protein ABJB11_16545 [Ferruginibacter sp.]